MRVEFRNNNYCRNCSVREGCDQKESRAWECFIKDRNCNMDEIDIREYLKVE